MRLGRLGFTPFVWLCLMGGLAIFSTTMSKNPALPLFIKSLDVDEGTLGFIAAASTVVGIFVSLPAGVLSDMWGRRRVIMLSMVVFASAPFLYLLVSLPWQLVLVRIYHGLATAILGPVALAAVADKFQEGRGEKMAWYSSATMIGRFVAPTIGGLLIFGNDFRWVYLACGLAGILALLAALAGYSSRSQGSPQPMAAVSGKKRTLAASWVQTRLELKVVFSHRDILTTSGMEAAQYFAFGAVETFLPLYLKGLGYQASEIGVLFTAQVIVTAFTKPIMGRLSDRWTRTGFISAGLLLGAAAVACMPWVSNWWLMAALTSLFGLGVASVTAATSALVSDLGRASSYGASLGILSSIMDVGHSTGPMVAGLLVATSGYRLAFSIVALVLVLASGLFFLLVREPKARH